MHRRKWIESGIVEELDQKQVRLLALVYKKIKHYYNKLHKTKACYSHPLSLSCLMKLTNRNSYQVTLALKYLANTIPIKSKTRKPLISYRRIQSETDKTHRPYQIFLNNGKGKADVM